MLRRLAVAVVAIVATALSAPAQDAPAKPPEGRFALIVGNADRAERLYLLTLGVEGGKPSVRVVGVAPKQSAPVLGPPTFAGGVLRFPLTKGGNLYDLEVRPDPKNPARYLGSLAIESRAFRATLEPTTLDQLTVADVAVPAARSELGTAIAKLRGGEIVLRRLADALPNAEEGKRMAKEADAVGKAEAPAIDRLRRKLAAAGEGAASVQAARDLLAGAAAANAPAADVAAWVGAVTAEAAPFGPKVVAQAREDLARYARRAGCGNVAVGFALEAAADPSLPKRGRAAALRHLAREQSKAGLDDDAVATTKRLAALDAELDAESRQAVPFRPTRYAGRTNKSANRVAVMELFTGAECPTCVAADVAFDALIARYEPADAVFLQYHFHNPQPDALANADGVARLLYHLEWHKEAIRGYPAPAFNGRPAAGGGGGGPAQAKAKYAEFTKLLDTTLEETTAVGVRGGVTRSGDDLTVTVELTGTKGLGDKAVLRLVLAEDAVKYAGGNGLRVHRHVVRSLLGTGEGVPLACLEGGKYTATHSLKDLRDELTEYMQTWGGPGRTFVFAERPLDLKGLKVVALVQDDATGEIVQAAQFGVPE